MYHNKELVVWLSRNEITYICSRFQGHCWSLRWVARSFNRNANIISKYSLAEKKNLSFVEFYAFDLPLPFFSFLLLRLLMQARCCKLIFGFSLLMKLILSKKEKKKLLSEVLTIKQSERPDSRRQRERVRLTLG